MLVHYGSIRNQFIDENICSTPPQDVKKISENLESLRNNDA
jgi:hypothetical protein